jgi:hypothetical protein
MNIIKICASFIVSVENSTFYVKSSTLKELLSVTPRFLFQSSWKVYKFLTG